MRFLEDRELMLSEVDRAVRTIDPRAVAAATKLIASTERIFFLGAGRSALALRMAAMRWMHLGVRSFVAGETTTPAIGQGDLLIAASASGRTSSVAHGVGVARAAGARILAVTTSSSTPIAEVADAVLLVAAGSKQDQGSSHSRQYAGSLFEQSILLLFDILFHGMWKDSGKSRDELLAHHANLE